MVQSTLSTTRTGTLLQCSRHVVSWMYFPLMLYQKTVFLGKWVLNRANFPDIFSFRNSHSKNLAWNIKIARFQGFIP